MTRLPIGERITEFPAGTWNTMLDRLDQLELESNALRAVVDLMRGHAAADHGGMVIHVVNKTGADLIEFGVAGLDQPAFDVPAGAADVADEAILNGVQFEVVAVDEDTHSSKFVITLEPIATNATGRAYLPNATWSRVDVQDEDDSKCGVTTGDSSCLESGKGTTPIIWKPTGTGVKWCIVELGGSSAASTIYLGQPTTNVTPSTQVFTLTNLTRFPSGESPDFIDVKNTQEIEVDSGEKVVFAIETADGEHETWGPGGDGSKATEFIGLTAQSVSSSDATFNVTVDELRQGVDPRADPVGNPSELISVKNALLVDIDSSKRVWVEENSDGSYSGFAISGGGGLQVIKGNATVSPTDATFTLNSIVVVRGDSPGVTSLTIKNEPPIRTSGSQTVYAVRDDTEVELWTTADAGNFDLFLHAYNNWSAIADMQILGHESSTKKWFTPTLISIIAEP